MNALNAAMLALVLINVVSLSYGFVFGNWGQWTEVSGTPCDSLCGGGSRIVTEDRACIGGLICRPINGGRRTVTGSCNIQSCEGICPGCVANIPNPNSNTSFYQCANGRALLMECPETTTFSLFKRECR